MNIQFKLQGTKQIKKLYVRIYEGKLDVLANTNLSMMKSDFNFDSQNALDSEMNEIIQSLKLSILRQFNLDFSKGVVIGKKWLENTIKSSQSRPKDEVSMVNEDWKIYISDFSEFWMDNYADKWKTSSKKTMSKVLKSQYSKFIELFLKYEQFANEKFTLKDFEQEKIYAFVEWLQEEEKYAISTIIRTVGRVRFFLSRAIQLKLQVNEDFKLDLYFDDEEEFDGIILSAEEIDRIIKKDYSFDSVLETTKDNATIALYTGLRISDFLSNLDISNFSDGFIKIITQKTKSRVIVPVHPEVEKVIKKYRGFLPPKQSKSDFNKHIKTLCQLSNIDEVVEGKLFDSKLQRKVFGKYHKYKLVTAHTFRRSYCSRYRGIIPDESLAKIMGWTTEKLISLYDQTSKIDHARKLAEKF